jgi:hypothetical protein
MDAIERATRWFFAGRNAWVLWPVGTIAVVLALAATGMLSSLLAGTFLIVIPLAWLAGLVGLGTRDHVQRVRANGRQLLRESGIPALWAALYTLPVWLLSNWMVGLAWWTLVVYCETERRARNARPDVSGAAAGEKVTGGSRRSP